MPPPGAVDASLARPHPALQKTRRTSEEGSEGEHALTTYWMAVRWTLRKAYCRALLRLCALMLDEVAGVRPGLQ